MKKYTTYRFKTRDYKVENHNELYMLKLTF